MGKKVGIVSCYFKNNYGSMLQAYATQKILDDNKIPNETINISELSDFSKGKKKYYFSQITNFNFIKAKLGMVKLKLYSKINKKLKKNFAIRNRKFEEFKRNFNLSKSFHTYKELSEYTIKRYSDVIVGSDQLWLPVNVVSDYYTLNWVPKEVNKISYATSFGISQIPKKYINDYSRFLKRIENISVRENNAVKLVKDVSEKNAKLVCDPTLLLTKEEWMDIQQEEPIINEKYIFCYFLGNNIEHRKFVERLKEKTGYKIVSINHCDEYVKYSDSFADIIPYEVGPSEFINYIRNAEYVCTDSFHGTVFSLINNTKFFTFERFNKKTKMSTNSRIYSLLEIVDLKDRLVFGNEDLNELLENKINFNKVNKSLENFRNESKNWLLNAITWENDNIKHINIEEKSECCGCTACKNICPKGAIEMVADEEGFLYPKVDKNKCINCGLCKKVCPILNRQVKKPFPQKAFVFQNGNDTIRKESTSGGAFSAFAEDTIKKNGVVFGVILDENFVAIHKGINNIEELWRFRNSKYVQSNPKSTFKEVKKLLDSNINVCFSGTSCQISGLKNYLGKDYENLILVDVVCRAVPSPLVLEKYLEIKCKKYPKMKKVLFRDKVYGYKYSNLSIYTENSENNYHRGVESDPYLRAFFSNICDRPSCYSCVFKTQYRESDITMWDCFNVEKFDKSLDDDKGTTRLLVHTEKGLKLIEDLKEKNIIKEIDVKTALEDHNGIFSRVKYNKKREQFFKDINTLEPEKIFEKYFPNTLKCKIERFLRLKLVRTSFYKKILNLGKKIRKRR